MSAVDSRAELRRMLRVCRICGYCNGFCDLFPAAARRLDLSDADLAHLAHLCHACRNCLYACQYAPPHVFAVNLPRALARLRHQVYLEQVWPPAGRWLLNHPWVALGLALATGWLLILALLALWPGADCPERLTSAAGGFYCVLPWEAMVLLGLLPLGWSGIALACSWGRYWRLNPLPLTQVWPGALRQTLSAILSLRNLQGGGMGCSDGAGGFSQTRRRLHQVLFIGLGLCLVSTLSAALYHHVLGLLAPYPLLSAPVLLGTSGGWMVFGATLGLGWLGLRADPLPRPPESARLDLAFIALLAIVSGSGLALLSGRMSPFMPLLLLIHLGSVLALFALLPYSKFVHAGYRAMALLREALERQAQGDSKGHPSAQQDPG